MKLKDLFKLAVQLLGLVFLYQALQAVPPALGQFLGSFPQGYLNHGTWTKTSGLSLGGMWVAFIMVAWPALVAYWLLRGAPLLLHIAFPEATARTLIGEPVAEKTETT